jgi:hypothetical protein
MGGAEGHDSTQLVLHEGLDLLGGASHVAATEADQIGMTGVGTDGNTITQAIYSARLLADGVADYLLNQNK